MKSLQEIADQHEEIITEELTYDDVISILQECKENNVPIDEGLFKAIFGGLGGATVGPPIMKGICKVLGIDEKGSMGSLMTSRLTLTALGAYLGWKN